MLQPPLSAALLLLAVGACLNEGVYQLSTHLHLQLQRTLCEGGGGMILCLLFCWACYLVGLMGIWSEVDAGLGPLNTS